MRPESAREQIMVQDNSVFFFRNDQRDWGRVRYAYHARLGRAAVVG